MKFLITRALENGSVIRKIHSIHCIYDMFQLLSGVSQFVSTGNAEFLQACYEKEEDRDTRELLEQIVRFSHVMSLCDVEKVDQIMEDLSRSLDQYDERQEKGKEIAYSIQSRRRKAATFHSQKCAWDAHFCENMIPAGNV